MRVRDVLVYVHTLLCVYKCTHVYACARTHIYIYLSSDQRSVRYYANNKLLMKLM